MNELIEEYNKIRPLISENIAQSKANLKKNGYKNVGFLSYLSLYNLFGLFAYLDMKRTHNDLGRFQIRLYKTGIGRLDVDTFDPDIIINAPAHIIVDSALLVLGELDLIEKNYIKFKFKNK